MKSIRMWGTKTIALALLLCLLAPINARAVGVGGGPRPIDFPNDPPDPLIDYVGDPVDGNGYGSRIDLGELRALLLLELRVAFNQLGHPNIRRVARPMSASAAPLRVHRFGGGR